MYDPIHATIQYRHDCSHIPDGPSHVQDNLVGMQYAGNGQPGHFYDRIGRGIIIPKNKNGQTSIPDGYAKALWDFRIDSLLLGDDNHTLYVRDVDRTGSNQLLDTWHAIGSLENEYHIPKAKTYLPWNDQMLVECAKLPDRVRHGIKFTNMAFIRTNGNVTRIPVDSPMFNQPYELTVDQPYDPNLARQAVTHLTDVTADTHSAKNLGRMFATPLLEPYKHLTYLMYGDGGNGKGILLSTLAHTYPDLAVSVDSQKLLGGRRGAGGFSTDQETLKLIGALWAYDEDADMINLDQMTLLKKISTGDTLTARRVQENAISFAPRCTFVIATNNPIVTTMSAASSRRFAYIRMRDGRKAEEFAPLLDFRKTHGAAPFLMASCKIWERYGDEPYDDVSIGSSDDLTDLDQDIITAICLDGYAPSSMLKDLKRYEQRELLAKLGLKRAGLQWISEQQAPSRVLEVKDETRFAPYRKAFECDREQLESQLQTITPIPDPIEADPLPLPSECGFAADYTPAGADKVARNWKRLAEDPAYDSTIRPDTDAYAVVPSLGMAIIDMDKPHADQPDLADGWTTLNMQVGRYGSDQFPATYLVGTPSGGVHAYYLLPGRLIGRLKNSVHNNGIPIDIRCERKGYVIGPGSHTMKGEYQLLDMPQDGVPIMSDQLADWLETNGYVEGANPTPHTAAPAPTPAPGTRTRSLPSVDDIMRDMTPDLDGNARPDMTPVPEGQRNDQLHAWAYGRLLNHPENSRNIESDLFARGHMSGLRDDELNTIWQSILRQLGGLK